jgi:hypothetical protein
METLSELDLADIKLIAQMRSRILLIMIGLVISGLTAFPIGWELHFANEWVASWKQSTAFSKWIKHVFQGVHNTNIKYPFIVYGTDWLGCPFGYSHRFLETHERSATKSLGNRVRHNIMRSDFSVCISRRTYTPDSNILAADRLQFRNRRWCHSLGLSRENKTIRKIKLSVA